MLLGVFKQKAGQPKPLSNLWRIQKKKKENGADEVKKKSELNQASRRAPFCQVSGRGEDSEAILSGLKRMESRTKS